MAVIIHVPEALRAKLGEDGTRELVALLDQTARGLRENIDGTAAERLERRLTETKADLGKQIAELRAEVVKQVAAAESRLMWKTLAFLAGQTGVVYLILKTLLK